MAFVSLLCFFNRCFQEVTRGRTISEQWAMSVAISAMRTCRYVDRREIIVKIHHCVRGELNEVCLPCQQQSYMI